MFQKLLHARFPLVVVDVKSTLPSRTRGKQPLKGFAVQPDLKRRTLTCVRLGRSNVLTWSNFRFAIDSNCSHVVLANAFAQQIMNVYEADWFLCFVCNEHGCDALGVNEFNDFCGQHIGVNGCGIFCHYVFNFLR
jgi:hypothetical protein